MIDVVPCCKSKSKCYTMVQCTEIAWHFLGDEMCSEGKLPSKSNLCINFWRNFIFTNLLFRWNSSERSSFWFELLHVVWHVNTNISVYVRCHFILETFKIFKFFFWIIHAAGIWKPPINCTYEASYGITQIEEWNWL